MMSLSLALIGPLARLALRTSLVSLISLTALPLAAQSCGDDPKPKVLVQAARSLSDTVTPEQLRNVDVVSKSAVQRAFGSNIVFVTEEELGTIADNSRLRLLLGADSPAMLEELAAVTGASDWILSIQVGSIGNTRRVNYQMLDARRGGVTLRGSLASFPVDGTGAVAAIETAVSSLASGLDCQLRRLRMTPVIPSLQVSMLPSRGQVGETLSVVVRLVDVALRRAPEPNKTITLEYTTPQGQVLRKDVVTDASGTASDTLVLGAAHPRAGMLKARFVRSDGYVKESVPINYYVLPAAPGRLNLVTDKAQLRPAGSDTVRAELKHNGAAVAGAAISLSASGGAVGTASVITDRAGQASVPYVAPTAPALVSLRATATVPADGSNVQANLSYVVDPGVVMTFTAGGDTVILGASSLKIDLEREQRPVAGATVAFSIAGGGTLSAASATTDSVGHAEVIFAGAARAGASTITATVTLDGQTYTRSVTVRYTDPLDAITREIADVKEAIWLDPSDANLSRLNRVRSTLLARGEAARAETLLGDGLVNGQLSCTQQRAHEECAAGLRNKGEATLGLLKSITSGSTRLEFVFDRSRESLKRCPFPVFMDRAVYVPDARVQDINTSHTWAVFLGLSWNGEQISGFSFSAHPEPNPSNIGANGFVPTGPGVASFSGRIDSGGDVRGMWGSRFLMIDHQQRAPAPTVSIGLSGTSVTASIDLYQQDVEGTLRVARIDFSTTVTLPNPPNARMCDHASLPRPGD